jgi:hypothetical protein
MTPEEARRIGLEADGPLAAPRPLDVVEQALAAAGIEEARAQAEAEARRKAEESEERRRAFHRLADHLAEPAPPAEPEAEQEDPAALAARIDDEEAEA